MYGQFVPQILGCTQTSALGPSLFPNAATGTVRPLLSTPVSLVTGVDSNMHAWLKIPFESASDINFVDSNRSPVTLRIWTNGGSFGTVFTRATYRLGIFRPATYTPDVANNGVAGSYDPTTPEINWLSSTTTDAHAADGSDWTNVLETSITITGHSASLITTTYKRGELVLYVTLPHANSGGCTFYIYGGGWLS